MNQNFKAVGMSTYLRS